MRGRRERGGGKRREMQCRLLWCSYSEFRGLDSDVADGRWEVYAVVEIWGGKVIENRGTEAIMKTNAVGLNEETGYHVPWNPIKILTPIVAHSA